MTLSGYSLPEPPLLFPKLAAPIYYDAKYAGYNANDFSYLKCIEQLFLQNRKGFTIAKTSAVLICQRPGEKLTSILRESS